MKKYFSKQQILTEVKNYFFIILGLNINAFAWTAFLIPIELIGGGVSGIASLIYFATNIPVGITIFVINTLLILLGIKTLGFKFGLKTFICIVISSLAFSIMQPLFPTTLVPDDTFLCALIGAILSGLGVGMSLNYGGNTGGLDIVALLIIKYKNISYGRLILYLNTIVVSASYFVVGSVEKLVYSFVVMIAYTFAADLIIDGHRQTFQIMIFSDKNTAIAQRINEELRRGATLLKGYGSYTKKESDILLVIAHRADRQSIIKIIKEIDNKAFISISKTFTVFGENFDELKL